MTAAPPLSAGMADTLSALDSLATQANVQFIIDSGTLLGLARQGDVLPGDYDIDLAVIDPDAIPRLKALAKGQVWRFAGRPYKFDATLPRLSGLVIDVKQFTRQGGDWVAPAIGATTPGGGNGNPLRRLLRPLWRQLLKRGDAARWPLRLATRIDAWRIPARFFDVTTPLAGYGRCHVPADLDGYLRYRYGDWAKPRTDWISWRDDGGYRRDARDLLPGATAP